ncbi:MAG TPA: class I SAM-dependent methyltransferase [Bacteroidia bacterium]|jgi:ubiquinone/menaquinone biosynthesis C-methylase UbiE|nr:class I SAM-dependent methyltransferase [Bacteroidia bacterium]
MADKDVVKELFENTALYLTYDYNLQIRKETVEIFTQGEKLNSVLDIPCGTGAISIPLLNRIEKLTLIDISSNMLAIAEKNIPAEFRNKTELINKNFFECNLPEKSYDLILCLGLLAHVESPGQLLNKLSSLVKPGGLLIIQNTDSKHFYSYFIRAYLGLKNLISKQPYSLNKVPAKLVEKTLIANGFELQNCFRYNQSFLGFSNLFSNGKKYKLTGRFFGDAQKNKNAAMGSDYTYLFKKIG